MTKEKLFWLYVAFRAAYVDEMTGEWQELIPQLKDEAKSLGIEWDDNLARKQYEWLEENLS